MKSTVSPIPLQQELGTHLQQQHWRDDHTQSFTRADRANTVVITTGLPELIMHFIKSAVQPLGVRTHVLPTPGNSALQYGKEYGNRGQCNPTYFTVGALIEHLMYLRDKQGMATKDIINNYIYATVGGCGPCRMGMYATEYRKALRDSGFQGFRVIVFSRAGNISSVDASGLEFSKTELLRLFMAVIIGDVLNTLEKRIRPYEIEKGATDSAIQSAKNIIGNAYKNKHSLLIAAWQCRKLFKQIQVNPLQPKPRVLVQGEFWAKTTEGEGNYNLYRFLEDEGAEVSNETLTDWIMHQIWRAKWDVERREDLAAHDTSNKSLNGQNSMLLKLGCRTALFGLTAIFGLFARIIGLKNPPLSDHDALAESTKGYFNLHVDGGEDHMEVAHHIHAFAHNTANMVLSVKPFTCLSSSGVSDGVQPAIAEKCPNSIFVAVETNGDAPANFYSRVQMQLFKAKQAAEAELEDALQKTNTSLTNIKARVKNSPGIAQAALKAKGTYASQAANAVVYLAKMQ